MAPYHVLMVYFPIALWMTATLALLLLGLGWRSRATTGSSMADGLT